MIFSPTDLAGVYKITFEPRIDDRGYFSRVFAHEEFAKAGINFKMVHTNQALTKQAGVLRGLHWQIEPKLEAKVFRCLSGKIFDVLADVRPDSPTYGKWAGFELSGDKLESLYIPGSLAHGYQTLVDNCIVEYMCSEFYAPDFEKGFKFDDPFFNIKWPLSPSFMSDKDKNLPYFK